LRLEKEGKKIFEAAGLLLSKINSNLKNMNSKILATLIIFIICAGFVSFLVSNGPTDLEFDSSVNGFNESAAIWNGQGIINYSNNGDVTIFSWNKTQPEVGVYSTPYNFTWHFSMAVLNASSGESNPLAFSINWQCGQFLVMVDQDDILWYNYQIGNSSFNSLNDQSRNFYYYPNSTKPNEPAHDNWKADGFRFILASNFTSTSAPLPLKDTYDITVDWNREPTNVHVNLSITSSSSIRNLTLTIPYYFNFDSAILFLQASAGDFTSSVGSFLNSQIMVHNSSYFTQESSIAHWLLVLSVLCVLAIVTLSFMAKTDFWRKMTKLNLKKYWIAVVLFIFFISIRIAIAAISPGHKFDTFTMNAWLNIIDEKGVTSIYSVSSILPSYMGLTPAYPYPPMIAYLLLVVHELLSFFGASYVNLILKFPAIFADILIGILAFIFVKGKAGYGVALLAAALTLLNFVDSALWGQYDSIVALFMVLAIIMALRRNLPLSWIFAALAILTKQTAIIFLPALFVLSIRQGQFRKLAIGFVAFATVILLFWIPFLNSGYYSLNFALGNLGLNPTQIGLNQALESGGSGTSIWSFNMWPIITSLVNGATLTGGIIGSLKDGYSINVFGFGFTYFQLSIAMFAILYLALLTKIWKEKDDQRIMLLFGLLLLVFYMVPTRSHSRYLLFGLTFLPFSFKRQKVVILSYVVLLVTYSLSLLYGLMSGPPIVFENIFGILFNDPYSLGVMIAANLVVFGGLLINEFRNDLSAAAYLLKVLFRKRVGTS
jgi:hypothetical protein